MDLVNLRGKRGRGEVTRGELMKGRLIRVEAAV